MHVLIKLPTRGRPEKALYTLERYARMLANPTQVTFVVNIDDDDITMNTDQMKQRLQSVAAPGQVDVHVANNQSKIEACNAGMEGRDFDILLLANDDVHPRVNGYDDVIRAAMKERYPDLDGVLHFNDDCQGPRLNTTAIMGKTYYRRFGFVYNPVYRSFFGNNELMDDATRLERLTTIDQTIMEHAPSDSHNHQHWAQDEYTYYHRKYYEIELSVLLCASRPDRAIEHNLRTQMERAKETEFTVELLIDEGDEGDASIDDQRNRLVQRATGCFACFVEEDDNVSTEYLDTIRDALYNVPDADVVELRGAYVVNGHRDRPFQQSRVHDADWEDRNGSYRRPPNHLNVIRTYIMQKFPFSRDEETAFALRLARSGLLTVEAPIPETAELYYRSGPCASPD